MNGEGEEAYWATTWQPLRSSTRKIPSVALNIPVSSYQPALGSFTPALPPWQKKTRSYLDNGIREKHHGGIWSKSRWHPRKSLLYESRLQAGHPESSSSFHLPTPQSGSLLCKSNKDFRDFGKGRNKKIYLSRCNDYTKNR